MMEYFFTFQSLTQAQAGLRVLKNRGIAASLKRTPRQLALRGCGYSLAVAEPVVHSAAATMHGADIRYNRLYRVRGQETPEEVIL